MSWKVVINNQIFDCIEFDVIKSTSDDKIQINKVVVQSQNMGFRHLIKSFEQHGESLHFVLETNLFIGSFYRDSISFDFEMLGENFCSIEFHDETFFDYYEEKRIVPDVKTPRCDKCVNAKWFFKGSDVMEFARCIPQANKECKDVYATKECYALYEGKE